MRTAPRFVASIVLLGALLAGSSSLVSAQSHDHAASHQEQESWDSAPVVAAVQAFHEALATGDTARVEALLAKDVRVLESGGLETREEYFSHHLPGDMTFARTVERERGPIQVVVAGDVAWTVATSRTTGTFRDREIDSRGAELMVLSRHDGEWRIRAIHWSSRQSRR